MSYWIPVLLSLAVAPASTPDPAPAGMFGAPPPGHNAVMLRGTFPVPHFGLALSYDRALGRRFSVGGEFEYLLPRVGFSHLAGFSETVDGRLWIGRALHGVFVETSLTAAHTVLVGAPQLSRTTLAPGAALGFRYTLRAGLSLGLSGGLRWAHAVVDQPLICTRDTHCAATRPGVTARVTADIGWVF